MDAQFTNNKEGVVLAQLPHDLITEVLQWLPVKSLLRFKCLSKSICAAIDSKHVINSHLNRSAQDRSHLNLIFGFDNQIPTNYNSFMLRLSDFDVSGHNGLKITGHCNGVPLLYVRKSELALWNPSTNQYRVLPRLPDRQKGDYFLMGLGYDSSRDDYKVVAFQFLKSEYRVWIYGLRSNSWKIVCTDFLVDNTSAFCVSHFGYFADGDLNWLYAKFMGCGIHVVAFDMSKETFSILVLPPCFSRGELANASLNVLDGSLCIASRTAADNYEARLYVRKKGGDETIWSLMYSVTADQLPPFFNEVSFFDVGVLGYSKEGDNKIVLRFCMDLVSYDIEEKSFQPIEFTKPIVKEDSYCKIISVVESLVSIKGGS